MNNPQIDRVKNQVIPTINRAGIKKAGLFGSVLRNDFN
jgi:putative transposase